MRIVLADQTAGKNIERGCWVTMLNDSPVILATWYSSSLPLGVLSVPGVLQGAECTFLMFPCFSQETGQAHVVSKAAREHKRAHPEHTILHIASNEAEQQALAQEGMDSFIVNANCFINEEDFVPLPDASQPLYDAVYNARLHPIKRHELAADLPSLALTYFKLVVEETVQEFHAAYARCRQLLPEAEFINTLTPAGCEFLHPPQLNAIYNQSKVGLCLSAIEGPMRVSMEYMLAGLPVVSTKSLGGRDYFFDHDFCLIVDDNPRAVREGTDALISRNIPRSYVRERTLKRVEQERLRFKALVCRLIEDKSRADWLPSVIDEIIRANDMQRWRTIKPFCRSIKAAVSGTRAV